MMYRNMVAVAVLSATLVGAGAGTAEAGTPPRAPVALAAHVSTSQAGPEVASGPSPGRYRAAADATGGGAASTEQVGPAVKAIIGWLKRNARGYYDSMVAAVKRGYNAFVSWYRSLPGWVQKGIEHVGGPIVLAELYDKLKDLL